MLSAVTSHSGPITIIIFTKKHHVLPELSKEAQYHPLFQVELGDSLPRKQIIIKGQHGFRLLPS
jgi:hypothetical protein